MIKQKNSPARFGDKSKPNSKSRRRKMNWKSTEPITLSLSLERIKEYFKEDLYNLGYAQRSNQCIAEVSFGALQDDHVPVQFWIEDKEPDREQEVTVIQYNGKST
jgi:hypothetical protein